MQNTKIESRARAIKICRSMEMHCLLVVQRASDDTMSCILRLLFKSAIGTGRFMQINRRRRQWRPVAMANVSAVAEETSFYHTYAVCLQTICELNFMESESNVAAAMRYTVLLKFYLPMSTPGVRLVLFVFFSNLRTF